MTTAPDGRIEAVYRRDRRAAWAFVATLWLVIGFVLVATWRLIDDPGVHLVLSAAAVLLLALNTASIAAMVAHYAEDKTFIYGLDLKHVDAQAARRRAAGPALRAAQRGSS
jgi:hypothetical protein